MKRLLLSLMFIVASFASFAYDFQTDGIYYNISSQTDLTCTVTKGDNPYTGDVIIPEQVSYDGKSFNVVGIGSSAFSQCSSLTSVVIPNGVTSIAFTAFMGCSSLTSVVIPNGVTSIASLAFSGCSSLASITIPNSVKSIGNSAFSGCSSLASITIPNSVKIINGGTFSGCSSLTSVTIPNSVTSIGSSAFSGCSSLTSVTIGNAVTSIGDEAFAETNLQHVSIDSQRILMGNSMNTYFGDSVKEYIIGNSVTSIGAGVFDGCSSLTSVSIPNSVTSIGDYAFYGCSSLSSVTIPDSVTEIGYSVFRECSSIISPLYNAHVFAYMPEGFQGSYVIPEGITKIAGGAFYGCHSIISVTIPNSVTSIGKFAFCGCRNLETVCNYVTTPEILASSYRSFVGISENAILYVPDESLTAYQESDLKSYFSQILPLSEYEATGITDVPGQNPSIMHADGIYSINGVRRPSLQKGLNIINGKKVWIK